MKNAVYGLACAALMLSAPLAAASGDMSVATFLTKAEALKKKGPLALMSGDFKLLKREVEASGAAYGKRIKDDKAAGLTPHSCPPAGTKLSLESDELLAHYRGYPAAQRGKTSVRQGFFDLMKKRFPCS